MWTISLLILYIYSLLALVYSKTSVLNVLVLVPWPDSRPYAGWDSGLDLLPGARIAIQEINNRSDILQEYTITAIEAGHAACGLTEHSLGYVNLAHYVFNSLMTTNDSVAAVLGMFCSTSTASLSPILGHEEAGLIHLSASNSPFFNQQIDRFAHLWRFLESASVYADMMIHLMEEYHWSKIAIVVNQESVFYTGIATSLVNNLKGTERKVIYQGGLLKLVDDIESQVLSELPQAKARIVFLAAEAVQIASFLCKAYQRKMLYPNYLWIIVDWNFDSLLSAGVCNESIMTAALEGSILSYYSFAPSSNSTVFEPSTNNYLSYLEKYMAEIKNVKAEYRNLILQTSTTVGIDPDYASLLYDQVWTFALALNKSLPELEANNISIQDYGFGQPKVTKILEDQLSKISFRGASGHVKFGKDREVETPIDIFHVSNGEVTATRKRINFGNNSSLLGFNFDSSLDDEVPLIYQTINPILTAIMVALTVTLLMLVTVVLGLILKLRNIPEIKAKSVKVSMLMFLACYIFVLGHIVVIFLTSVKLSNNMYSVLCNLKYFLLLNASLLLFATLFLKLERVHRIFHNTSWKIYSWRYTNWMIALKVTGICLVGNILILIAIFIKPVQQRFLEEFQPSAIEGVLYPYCHVSDVSNYLFTGFFVYLGVFMLLNVYLAYRARKITKKDFKNTTIINAYMIIVLTTLVLSLLLKRFFFVEGELILYENVVSFFCTFLIAVLSQLILFMPSIFHVLIYDRRFYTSLFSFNFFTSQFK